MTTRTEFPVLYTEVDRMGIVHHSNYPLWFEKCRQDYLRKAGIPSSKIAGQGFFLPLSEIECRFKRPAKYGDVVLVITKILSMSCVRTVFGYEVFDKAKGKLLATGKTVHVWTNLKVEPVNMEKEGPDIYRQLKRFFET
ncbi:MAG TPA: thioesterase family protein [Clostridia bacterium]|nr:thioesterase family protein [Clostridia bacterium]